MRCNAAGLDIIKRYEGFSAAPYLCPAGVWTNGFGNTEGVTPDTPPVTPEDAERRLAEHVARLEVSLERMFYYPVNDNQWSACVSLAYNVGAEAFRNSTIRALVNRKEYLAAADEFHRWVYGGGRKLAGLVKRREEERALFLRPVLVS